MAVKIRLQRKGRTKRPFYHIVVADARAPRDGRFIERLGVYNPMTKPATIELDQKRAYEWLTMGAQPTDTARAILRFKGVMFYKHLMRGVKKGAMTQDEAEAKWNDWMEKKNAAIAERKAASDQEHAEWLAHIDGTVKAVKKAESEVVSDDPQKSPQAVAGQQKTLAEIAAEKAPAGLEISGDDKQQEEPAAEETEEASEEPAAEATEEASEEPAAEVTEEASEEPAAEAAEEASAEPAVEEKEEASEEPAAEETEEASEEPAAETEDAAQTEEETPASETEDPAQSEDDTEAEKKKEE